MSAYTLATLGAVAVLGVGTALYRLGFRRGMDDGRGIGQLEGRARNLRPRDSVDELVDRLF